MPEPLLQIDPPFIPSGWPTDPARWTSLQHQLMGFYEFWPRPGLAEIPQAVRPWGMDRDAFFWKPATGAIDRARTAALEDYDFEIRTRTGNLYHGVLDGVPFQVADTTSRTVKVQLQNGNFFALPKSMAFPEGKVRIQGDPAPGSTIDRHCILYNPAKGELCEMISMRKSAIPFLSMGATYVATRGVVWDTKKPWSQTKGGVCAAQIPYLPLMITYDDITRGQIDHVMGLVMNNYAPTSEGITGPARGGDGRWQRHPVRSGERLRLREDVYREWMVAKNYQILSDADRIFLEAARRMGFVVMDKQTNETDGSGHGAIVAAADYRLDDLYIPLSLSDLEVVSW